MNKLFLFISFFTFYTGFAQQIDVQHYAFRLHLSDSSDRITGEAEIRVNFPSPLAAFVLDLVQVKPGGKGMRVDSVKGENIAGFSQADDKIMIRLGKQASSVASLVIFYSGVPADGLVISKNKYGDRTFFSDNWPNRAHHWIPCNDHPGDKASVEFTVTAPVHYQVVSNGIQVEETNLDKTTKRTRWKEEIPVSTKVMVIGVAQFAVARVDSAAPVPVTAWVYPQDREKGFYDYALANEILQFFSDYIGPYAFKKLANVQSKTIFGGMENASTIFYAERSVTGNRKSEDLIAHEIAHQWFGNMATEKSFPHLWLSEGFATYLTDIYWERKYGKEAFHQRLQEEREEVIGFNRQANTPVVDSLSPLMDLLNDNSYEKGAWVLHMLRAEVGDEAFHQVIRAYYDQYKGENADTRDFQAVAERVSGKNLGAFFDQWLYKPGLPRLSGSWSFDGSKINVTITQSGKNTFHFPLQVGIVDASGKQTMHTVSIASPKTSFTFTAASKPSKLVLDPNTSLLFEGALTEKK